MSRFPELDRFIAAMTAIREEIRQKKGNTAWTKLQSVVFSEGLAEARMTEGFEPFLLWLKYKYAKLKDGYITVGLILFYTAGRFIIDFWRDEKIYFLHLSLGQLTSLTIFLITIMLATISKPCVKNAICLLRTL